MGPKPTPPGDSSNFRKQPKRSPVKSRTHHGAGLWERIVAFWERIVAFCGKVEYAVAWFGLVVVCLCTLTLVAFLLFTGNEIMALILLVPTCCILTPLFKARRRG